MRTLYVFAGATALSLSAPLSARTALEEGIWSNTEDEYFAEEEGREKPDWLAIEVNGEGQWRPIDAFGAAQTDWLDSEVPGLSEREEGGWQVDGSEIRRANFFSCWFAVRKFASKPDGSDDWTFQRELAIFDQGGRVRIDGNGVAPDVTFRLRNVTWAKGSTNNPVLVLYIHKDDPVRAESYSWAAPDSAIVGINLRWVQGGCNRPTSPPGPQAGPR